MAIQFHQSPEFDARQLPHAESPIDRAQRNRSMELLWTGRGRWLLRVSLGQGNYTRMFVVAQVGRWTLGQALSWKSPPERRAPMRSYFGIRNRVFLV